MRQFRNILLVAGSEEGPVSEETVRRAVGLAKRNDAKLTLIDVVRELDLFREILPPVMLDTIRRERIEKLVRAAEKAHDDGVEAETALVVGRPFVEEIRRVQRYDHDLVITDGGLRRKAGGVIDNRTMQLMRKCPCAVWVVRRSTRGRYGRILAAIDPHSTEPGKDSLNQKIMRLAISTAEAERSELHVVYVWETPASPQAGSAEAWKRWEMTARSEVKRDLFRFLSGFDMAEDPNVHFMTGRPARGISEIASRESIDLLVMGTVRKTGIRGFFIGHTAEEVLGRVSCSLLTVKPDGFVSPV